MYPLQLVPAYHCVATMLQAGSGESLPSGTGHHSVQPAPGDFEETRPLSRGGLRSLIRVDPQDKQESAPARGISGGMTAGEAGDQRDVGGVDPCR